MSLSQAERQLPQYCFCHPRGRWRSFQPHEGRFIENKSKFVCNACDQARRREQANHVQKSKSTPIEDAVVLALRKKRYQFVHHFKLGKYEFDFAFHRQRLLVDVDGRTYHKHGEEESESPEKVTRRKFVEQEGWRLVRLLNGPGLEKRVIRAVMEAAQVVNACSLITSPDER